MTILQWTMKNTLNVFNMKDRFLILCLLFAMFVKGMKNPKKMLWELYNELDNCYYDGFFRKFD